MSGVCLGSHSAREPPSASDPGGDPSSGKFPSQQGPGLESCGILVTWPSPPRLQTRPAEWGGLSRMPGSFPGDCISFIIDFFFFKSLCPLIPVYGQPS